MGGATRGALTRSGKFLRASFRNRDVLLLALLMGLFVAAWAVMRAADAASEEVVSLDARVLLAFRSAHNPADAIGSARVEEMVRDITALGSFIIILCTTAVAVGYLLLSGQPRLALLVLVAVLGGWLINDGLKEAFARDRPVVVPHLMRVGSPSFPSGHTMLSAILYPTLAAVVARGLDHTRLKLYAMSLAVGVAVAVGVSRMYLGVHYPSDVVSGWAVGLGWALTCSLAARILQRKGKVEPDPVEDHRHEHELTSSRMSSTGS